MSVCLCECVWLRMGMVRVLEGLISEYAIKFVFPLNVFQYIGYFLELLTYGQTYVCVNVCGSMHVCLCSIY